VISVTGVPQVKASLARIALQAEAASPVAARAGARYVEAAAKQIAPRNTGALVASITTQMDGDDAAVGPTVDYARFPNFGTRYIAAQHFMEQAAQASTPQVGATMVAILRAAIG
jgi:HK97 gp10 family phage protein